MKKLFAKPLPPCGMARFALICLMPARHHLKMLFTAGGFFAGILCSVSLNAQSINIWNTNTEFKRCGQVEYENYLRSQDPNFDLKREEMEKVIQKGVAKFEQAKLSGNPQPYVSYTLPIVVHVLWNTAAQNVTDAKVTDMIAQLNMDWSRTNTDAGNTPAVWQPPVAANMEIQFCLATKDPSGAPTNGIVHKNTTITDFSASGDPQFSAQGGDDAWDFNKYLNIWVANIGSGLLGYASFPPVSSSYGTVINYISVGSLTNPNPAGGPFGYGRTLSHEIGHNFTLQHIWDGGCPANGDGVTDTPGQQSPTSGCPTFPALDACQTASPGYMFVNYMDYTDDLCYNMFTTGQKTKCQSAISTYLMSIANNASVVCGPAAALDAGINSIVSPNGIACNATFTPVVKLMNYGATTLTSCTINYNIDASPNQTFNWTGSLATAASTNVTLTSMTTTAGTHTFTSSSSSPNAGTDGNPGNNQSTSAFTVAGTAQNPPIVEGIESAFPPAGWTINNPDALTTWAKTTVAAKTGTASMFMDDFNYNASGQVDELTLPPLDLQFFGSPTMTFQVAYQLYTNPSASPNYSDTLRVQTSTDCGVTWSTPYFKYGSTGPNQLTTATPVFSTVSFTPTASQWRLETVSLPNTASVLVRFRHTSDYENQMYVDDINITGTGNPGVNELNINDYVSVYPNPSSGAVTLYVSLIDLGQTGVKITNVLGEIISEAKENISIQNKFNFDLSRQPDGMYFVEVKTSAGFAVKKVMISK